MSTVDNADTGASTNNELTEIADLDGTLLVYHPDENVWMVGRRAGSAILPEEVAAGISIKPQADLLDEDTTDEQRLDYAQASYLLASHVMHGDTPSSVVGVNAEDTSSEHITRVRLDMHVDPEMTNPVEVISDSFDDTPVPTTYSVEVVLASDRTVREMSRKVALNHPITPRHVRAVVWSKWVDFFSGVSCPYVRFESRSELVETKYDAAGHLGSMEELRHLEDVFSGFSV